MPSPIAHLTAGYIVARLTSDGGDSTEPASKRLADPRLLTAAFAFSLLPDLDSVAGLLLGNFGRYHNSGSHSLLVGLFAALIIGGAAKARRASFRTWFLLSLLCYEMHVVLDYFTLGRGVMALWPLTSKRFLFPLHLFYGFHWSDGLFSVRHIWTVLTELAFAAFVVTGHNFMSRLWARLGSDRERSQVGRPEAQARAD